MSLFVSVSWLVDWMVGWLVGQGRWQKNFQGKGQRKKQDRKIAPLSLILLYQYHVWKSRDGHGPTHRRCPCGWLPGNGGAKKLNGDPTDRQYPKAWTKANVRSCAKDGMPGDYKCCICAFSSKNATRQKINLKTRYLQLPCMTFSNGAIRQICLFCVALALCRWAYKLGHKQNK